MALILKSTKLIHGLVSYTYRRGLIGRRKNYFLQQSNGFNFNGFPIRTTVSLPAEDTTEKEIDTFEKSLNQLSVDFQNRVVFINDIQNVFTAIKQRGEMSFSQIILLLKCCSEVTFMSSRKERIKLVEEIWNTAVNFGTKFNISHYNALLNAFLENNHNFSPSQFLTILENEGLQPNLVTYRRILRAYCQMGNMDGANSVLEKMEALNLPMNEEDFNSLILGYSEVGDLEKANDVLRVMKDKDVDPTSRTYTFLLCGYAKHGEIGKMTSLLREVSTQDAVLSDSQLLEIVYVLAANGRMQDTDIILQDLQHTYQVGLAANKIVQRLLHEGRDKEALRLFERIERTLQSVNFLTTGTRNLLTHFVVYRSPVDVLNLYQLVTSKEWYKLALAHVLRETFRKRDEVFCVELLREMRTAGVEVREHYYWPALIKALKKGNKMLPTILKAAPNKLLTNSTCTIRDIIFPKYEHGEDWYQDYVQLTNWGLKKSILSTSYIVKFLREKQFDKVEFIASSLPVGAQRVVAALYTRLFPTCTEDHKRFVYVLYCLAQEEYFYSSGTTSQAEESVEVELEGEESKEPAPNSKAGFYDSILILLAESLTDQDAFLRVLENMSERNVTIHPETASWVGEKLKNEDIVAAANKLADPDVKFHVDEEILTKKFGRVFRTKGPRRNIEDLTTEMLGLTSPDDQCTFLRQLVVQGRPADAMVLLEQLPPQAAPVPKYTAFLSALFSYGRMDWVEEALNVGIEKGFATNKVLAVLARNFVNRGNIERGTDIYCEFMKRMKSTMYFVELLEKIVASKDEDSLKKFMNTACQYRGEYNSLSNLALALARDGQLKKAKKLLDMKMFKITQRTAYFYLEITYKGSSTEQIENIITFLRDMEDIDRVPAYKLLISKYASDNNLEKAKELWCIIEEDDISNFDFLAQVREFMNNPTLDNLKNLSSKFETVDYAGPVGAVSYKNLLEMRHLRKAFSVAMSEDVPAHLVQKLLELLAAEGRVSEIIELVGKYKTQLSIKGTREYLISEKQFLPCLEFLNHFANEGKHQEIVPCLKSAFPLAALENPDFMKLYKSLAIECYEKTQNVKPLLCYFASCICTGNMIKEAEELLDRYPDQIKSVPFQEMQQLVKPQGVNFGKGILSSDKLRSLYSDQIPTIYGRLIVFNCIRNQLDAAVILLHRAKEAGVANQVNKDSLNFLEKKLLAKGVAFPHPELLESETT